MKTSLAEIKRAFDIIESEINFIQSLSEIAAMSKKRRIEKWMEVRNTVISLLEDCGNKAGIL